MVLQKIPHIIHSIAKFVKPFLHIFSIEPRCLRIFCVLVGIPEAKQIFLVKMNLKNSLVGMAERAENQFIYSEKSLDNSEIEIKN